MNFRASILDRRLVIFPIMCMFLSFSAATQTNEIITFENLPLFFGPITEFQEESDIIVNVKDIRPYEVSSIKYTIDDIPIEIEWNTSLKFINSSLVILLPLPSLNSYEQGKHSILVEMRLLNGRTISKKQEVVVDWKRPEIKILSKKERARNIEFLVRVKDLSQTDFEIDLHENKRIFEMKNLNVKTKKMSKETEYQISIPKRFESQEVNIVFNAWDGAYNTQSVYLVNNIDYSSQDINLPFTGMVSLDKDKSFVCIHKVNFYFTGLDETQGVSGNYYDVWYSPEKKEELIKESLVVAEDIFRDILMQEEHPALLDTSHVEFINPSEFNDYVFSKTDFEIKNISSENGTAPPYTEKGVVLDNEYSNYIDVLKSMFDLPYLFFYDRNKVSPDVRASTNIANGGTIIDYVRTGVDYEKSEVPYGTHAEFQKKMMAVAIVHEIGHQLGLGHDTETGTGGLMWPDITPINAENIQVPNPRMSDRAYSAACVEGFEHKSSEWVRKEYLDEGKKYITGCNQPGFEIKPSAFGNDNEQVEECEVKWSDYFMPGFVKYKANPHNYGDKTPGGIHKPGEVAWCPYMAGGDENTPNSEIVALHPGNVQDLCYVDDDNDENTPPVLSNNCTLCAPPKEVWIKLGIDFKGDECSCYTLQEMIDKGIPEKYLPPKTGGGNGGGGGPATPPGRGGKGTEEGPPTTPGCGNGIVEPPTEECENDDQCEVGISCTECECTNCGNGKIDNGEECDWGPNGPGCPEKTCPDGTVIGGSCKKSTCGCVYPSCPPKRF